MGPAADEGRCHQQDSRCQEGQHLARVCSRLSKQVQLDVASLFAMSNCFKTTDPLLEHCGW
jgi:hypothetical protein